MMRFTLFIYLIISVNLVLSNENDNIEDGPLDVREDLLIREIEESNNNNKEPPDIEYNTKSIIGEEDSILDYDHEDYDEFGKEESAAADMLLHDEEGGDSLGSGGEDGSSTTDEGISGIGSEQGKDIVARDTSTDEAGGSDWSPQDGARNEEPEDLEGPKVQTNLNSSQEPAKVPLREILLRLKVRT